MTVKQRGDSYQVDVMLGGVRHRKQFPTRAEADAYLAQLQAQPQARPQAIPEALRGKTRAATSVTRITTLGAMTTFVCNERWAGKRAEMTLVKNANAAVKFFGRDFLLEDISSGLVDEYVAWLVEEHGNSGATINRKLSALSVILKRAAKRGDLDRLPHIERRSEAQHRERVLSAAEEQAVLRTLEQWGRPDLAHLVAFLVDTGLRVGQEALRLTVDDVQGANNETCWVLVRDGKGGTQRRVPLTKRAERIVQDAAREARLRGDPKLFPVSYTQVRHQWDRVRDHLGYREDRQFVIHMLRHTCASRLCEAGVDLLRVKDWLGHTTLATTQRYAHLSKTALASAVGALEPDGSRIRLVSHE